MDDYRPEADDPPELVQSKTVVWYPGSPRIAADFSTERPRFSFAQQDRQGVNNVSPISGQAGFPRSE